MTSVLHYRDPIAYRSDFMSTSSYHSPSMDHIKRSPPYDGHSSGSESRKNSTPGTKKRPSRAGTRSVTTLTAAQLERKRANDREAQRAIRQRTKDHIDTLERQVRDLTTQLDNSSSTRMMELMRRNEELEQENAVLRARLGHAVSALGVPEHNTGMSLLSLFFPVAQISGSLLRDELLSVYFFSNSVSTCSRCMHLTLWSQYLTAFLRPFLFPI